MGCPHGTKGDTVPASQAVALAVEVQLGSDQELCHGTGIEGTDIMDVKGEAAVFGRAPDLENQGQREVRCFGADPGIVCLTQWDTLCGFHWLSLRLGHRVGKFFVFSFTYFVF